VLLNDSSQVTIDMGLIKGSWAIIVLSIGDGQDDAVFNRIKETCED
jgi:hypothetical protein